MHGQVAHPTKRVEASGRTFRPFFGGLGLRRPSCLRPIFGAEGMELYAPVSFTSLRHQ
jgi:hypothetical protein